jgi:hypothetical protein
MKGNKHYRVAAWLLSATLFAPSVRGALVLNCQEMQVVRTTLTAPVLITLQAEQTKVQPKQAFAARRGDPTNLMRTSIRLTEHNLTI